VSRRAEAIEWKEGVEGDLSTGPKSSASGRWGASPPKQVVVWVSDTEPGAGHEIRSVDEHGQTRWIEVKSTTGADGWFEWPRREFERAITARQ